MLAEERLQPASVDQQRASEDQEIYEADVVEEDEDEKENDDFDYMMQ